MHVTASNSIAMVDVQAVQRGPTVGWMFS